MNYKNVSVLLLCVLLACGDDDSKPKTLPEVATSPVVVLDHTFTIRGQITDTGNDKIISAGIVYSSVNELPVLTDSKVEFTNGATTFSTTLDDLPYATDYHARAYATNSVGTAYGNVITFNTGNAPPSRQR